MSDPSALAGIPALLGATRACIEANAPTVGVAGGQRAMLLCWLVGTEVMAELLVESVPAAAEASRRPPQQVHAPLGDLAEPRVPRRADGADPGPNSGLPPGRYHP